MRLNDMFKKCVPMSPPICRQRSLRFWKKKADYICSDCSLPSDADGTLPKQDIPGGNRTFSNLRQVVPLYNNVPEYGWPHLCPVFTSSDIHIKPCRGVRWCTRIGAYNFRLSDYSSHPPAALFLPNIRRGWRFCRTGPTSPLTPSHPWPHVRPFIGVLWLLHFSGS